MESKIKTYSLLIKIGIGIVAGIFAIVLLCQYITLAKLNNQNNSLSQEYETLVAQKSDLENQKQGIESDYENFVTDYARDQHNYTQEDEILINKN